MREADLEAVAALTVLVLRTPLVIVLLRRDERRLDEAQLARAWWPATRDLSALLIGSLALFVHATRTRRTWRGAALGLAAMLLCELATGLVLEFQYWALQGYEFGNR